VKKNKKINSPSAVARLYLNRTILSVTITVFAIIISFQAAYLKTNFFLTSQLVIAIPLLLTSTLSLITAQEHNNVQRWTGFASTLFILGYAFLSNVIGLLIAFQISIFLGVAFFFANWVLVLVYSYLKISLKESTFIQRFRKDLFFIGIQIIFGLFPALGLF